MKKILTLLFTLFALTIFAQEDRERVPDYFGVNLRPFTSTQINNLSNVREGDMRYNSTLKKFQSYNGTSWEELGSSLIYITQADYDLLSQDEKDNGNFAIIGLSSNGGGNGTVESVVAGTNISVDNADPANPIINSDVDGSETKLSEGTNVTISGAGTVASPYIINSTAGTGGTTDHGSLTGLGDDDHAQYYNQTRGDARYSQLGHNHAAAETTSGTFNIARIPTGTTSSTVSLGNHTHNASDISAGTLAIARIPTGTTSSTVSLGNHTHTIANITSLQSSLDGKAATSHTHTAAQTTSGVFDIARIPTGSTGSTVALGNHTHTINTGDIADGAVTKAKINSSFYEEGTFTPTFFADTSDDYSQISGFPVGQYVRVGNQVTVYVEIQNLTGSGTGFLRVGNMPFLPSDEFSFTAQVYGVNQSFYSIIASMQVATGYVSFYIQTSLDGALNEGLSDITFSNAMLKFSGTYITND